MFGNHLLKSGIGNRILLLLFAVLLSGACTSKKGIKIKSPEHWDIDIKTNPLSITLLQKPGGKRARITGGEQSGLFYITEQDTQYLTMLEQQEENSRDTYQASFTTTDNRAAQVVVTADKDGFIGISFEVKPEEGIIRKGAFFEAFPDEQYVGLMERVVDGPQKRSWEPGITEALDLRGQKLTMVVKPTLGIYVPFYVSDSGYGVLVNGTWPGEYDMAATQSNRVAFSFEGPSLAITVVPGPKPMDVVKNYTRITGAPILPPRWAFSIFHWRDNHHNQDKLYDGTPNIGPYNADLTEDVLMLEALDIPYGVYWIDRPWAVGPRGYSDFEWDPERFPRAEEMIKWLEGKDKKLLLWIAPWIMGDMLKEAETKGYLVPGSRIRREKGPEDVIQLIDFTNPGATAWWGTYLQKMVKQGVVAFKLDRSEEIMPDEPSITLHNGKAAREVRNEYPKLYLKAAYDALKKSGTEDFLLMPRATYTGSQQYGVFWGGDTPSGPWGLRTTLIGLQRSAFMGLPFWGSDTGGYWGKREDFTRESVARWLAFSCFNPIMEVGPLRDSGPWNMPYKPSYDTTLIAIYRLYATIHTRLQDYSYQHAVEAHRNGTPIVKPLLMAYPDDEKARKIWDEYLYGDDILVGIIWKNDQRVFDMYLPEGTWKDAWTGEEYEGEQTVKINSPIHKIPVFIRSESSVELGDLEALYEESLELAANKPDLMRLQKEAFGQ